MRKKFSKKMIKKMIKKAEIEMVAGGALWSGKNKNRDVSTGPHARPFARSLAPLTHSLATLCSHLFARSLARQLAHSPPSTWEKCF